MSTILPPPPVNFAASPTTAAMAQTVLTVTSPPPLLLEIPAGTIMTATLLGPAGPGAINVATDMGKLTLRTGLNLPPDTQLTLQLSFINGIPQMRLAAINGQSVSAFATTPGRASVVVGSDAAGRAESGTLTPTGGDATRGHAVALTVGGTVNGTVLRGPAAAFAPLFGQSHGLPTLSPGSDLTLRLLSAQLPEAGAPFAPSSSAPFSGGMAQTSFTPGAQGMIGAALPSAAPTSAPVTTAGQFFATHPPAPGTGVAAPTMPGAPAPSGAGFPPAPLLAQAMETPPAPPPANYAAPLPATSLLPSAVAAGSHAPMALSGIVAANSASGHPLVQTDAGLIALGSRTDFPPGTALTFELVAQTAGIGQGPAPLSRAGIWSGMEQAITQLAQSEPEAARQILDMLPQLGPRFAANMAIMMSALKAGSLRDWLGETNVKSLEKGVGKAGVKQLSKDFEEAGAKSRGPSRAGAWQAASLPFYNGAAIEMIRLYVRPPPPDPDEQKESQGGGPGTRFLVNIELSQIGAFQMDGLLRSPRRFDLVIRTHSALPETWRHDIGGIFAQACDLTGVKGGVSFQATPNLVEVPDDDAAGPEPGSGFVV